MHWTVLLKLELKYLFVSDMSAPLVDLGGHAVNIGRNSSIEPPLTQDSTTILLETIAAIIGTLQITKYFCSNFYSFFVWNWLPPILLLSLYFSFLLCLPKSLVQNNFAKIFKWLEHLKKSWIGCGQQAPFKLFCYIVINLWHFCTTYLWNWLLLGPNYYLYYANWYGIFSIWHLCNVYCVSEQPRFQC